MDDMYDSDDSSLMYGDGGMPIPIRDVGTPKDTSSAKQGPGTKRSGDAVETDDDKSFKTARTAPFEEGPYDYKATWKGEPKDTLSDWKIEIADDSGKVVATYNVHKFPLAFGKRHSKYFAKVFRSDHFNESSSSTSHVVLDPVVASAFPQLLDYIYETGQALNVQVEDVVALHWLADYFEIPQLNDDIKKFVHGKKMTVDKAHFLLEQAVALNNHTMIGFVEEFLGKHASNLSSFLGNEESMEKLKDKDPKLLADLLTGLLKKTSVELGKKERVVKNFFPIKSDPKNRIRDDYIDAPSELREANEKVGTYVEYGYSFKERTDDDDDVNVYPVFYYKTNKTE